MDINKVDEAIKRAQMLMNSPEFNSKVESFKGSKSSLSQLEEQAFGSKSSLSQLEEQAFGTSSKSYVRESVNVPIEKLTQEQVSMIKEHAVNNPSYVCETAPSYMYENFSKQSRTNSVVDYNKIQEMINETVSKALGGKKQLNEDEYGTLQAMKLCPGNKLLFVDSKGNVFEANLQLKKKK